MKRSLAASGLAAFCLPFCLLAQISGALTVAPSPVLEVKAGSVAVSKLQCRLAPGYHTNSNKPSEEYLIPFRVAWDPSPLTVTSIEYPKGTLEKYEFAPKPISVYSGEFEVVTHFKAPADAPKGARTLTGKLRYQACTEKVCYPPKTIPIQVPVEIR